MSLFCVSYKFLILCYVTQNFSYIFITLSLSIIDVFCSMKLNKKISNPIVFTRRKILYFMCYTSSNIAIHDL